MSSRTAARTACTRDDVLTCQYVVWLGRLDTPDTFDLALQAMCKAGRVWPRQSRLVVAGQTLSKPFDGIDASWRPRSSLQQSLQAHAGTGRLLVPATGLDLRHLLHAIASGTPIEALNLTPHPPCTRLEIRKLDAFVAMYEPPAQAPLRLRAALAGLATATMPPG